MVKRNIVLSSSLATSIILPVYIECAVFTNTSSYHCLCQILWHHQCRHRQKLESFFHWYQFFWKRLTAHHGFVFILYSGKPKRRKTAAQNNSGFCKPDFSTICRMQTVAAVSEWGSSCYGEQAALLQSPSKMKGRVFYDSAVNADHTTQSCCCTWTSYPIDATDSSFYVFLKPSLHSGCCFTSSLKKTV